LGWTRAAEVTMAPTANGDQPQALLRLLKVRLLFAKGDPWGRYFEPSNLGSPVMSLLNVRYVISRLPELPGGPVKLGEAGGSGIYENRNVLPRFFLVGRVRFVRDMEEGLQLMGSPDFDARRLAVVEGSAKVQAAAGGEVRVVSYQPERVVLETDSPEGGYLVTSETWYPGWRAYVDGVEHPLCLTNVAFRGLPVPAGKHNVVMRFRPSILNYGAWLSLLAAALLLAALVFGDNMRERAPWNSSSTSSPPSTL